MVKYGLSDHAMNSRLLEIWINEEMSKSKGINSKNGKTDYYNTCLGNQAAIKTHVRRARAFCHGNGCTSKPNAQPQSVGAAVRPMALIKSNTITGPSFKIFSPGLVPKCTVFLSPISCTWARHVFKPKSDVFQSFWLRGLKNSKIGYKNRFCKWFI